MIVYEAYLKGSKERKELVAALQETAATCEDVPIVIGDEEIRTNDVRYQVMVSRLKCFNDIFRNKFVAAELMLMKG
jgi:hypothetical protein